MPTNYERAFEDRPEVYAAWASLNGAIKVARDRTGAGLDEADLAVMEVAERVADDAASIEDADRQRLRDLCVRPDAGYRELEPDLRDALVVGRPIADPE